MKNSAGLLIYRNIDNRIEVFLVHPGGPFWKNKDAASWSIPKGEFEEGEDPLEAAKREFSEETNLEVPEGKLVALEPVKQPSRKIVHVWYLKGNLDDSLIRSNMFELEWPPKSGKMQEFPEVDKANWYSLGEAKYKIHKGQIAIIEQLEKALGLQPIMPLSEAENTRQGSLF
uniref:Predicted NTP pyrophosphohydrolase, NUDIX family n=1 Tax=Candidatus Kentrum sp. LFY TaxID=2126342 RepID=A0A450X4E0_9GAMM|nr:MAG: Predicted NTP pyrophosphohydrolase, NUDIX family [Candidatus Kentron sp. LFY]